MENPRNKWIEAATKLVQLTNEGKIKWSVDTPPPSLRRDPNQQVDVVFKTEYQGQNMQLYERHYKELPLERDWWPIIGRAKQSEWKSEVMLEFVDDRGRAFWFFPKVNPLNHLLSAVQYQRANINDFIDKLLLEQ